MQIARNEWVTPGSPPGGHGGEALRRKQPPPADSKNETITFLATRQGPHLFLLAYERFYVTGTSCSLATAAFNFSSFRQRTFGPLFFSRLGQEKHLLSALSKL